MEPLVADTQGAGIAAAILSSATTLATAAKKLGSSLVGAGGANANVADKVAALPKKDVPKAAHKSGGSLEQLNRKTLTKLQLDCLLVLFKGEVTMPSPNKFQLWGRDRGFWNVWYFSASDRQYIAESLDAKVNLTETPPFESTASKGVNMDGDEITNWKLVQEANIRPSDFRRVRMKLGRAATMEQIREGALREAQMLHDEDLELRDLVHKACWQNARQELGRLRVELFETKEEIRMARAAEDAGRQQRRATEEQERRKRRDVEELERKARREDDEARRAFEDQEASARRAHEDQEAQVRRDLKDQERAARHTANETAKVECPVCLDEYKNRGGVHVVNPCGHAICAICAPPTQRKGKGCHICRGPFNSTIRVVH